ncbi:MAG: ribonuclease P protein component [Proteobacteria bacterium]|nr:ribonuclease P protein component [Pseudomonadota bacterium]
MARTAHFFLYALPRLPAAAQAGTPHGLASAQDAVAGSTSVELSTGQALVDTPGVDDLPGGVRFGLVLPKKQARRSVTRSLIRHQAREAVRRHAPGLRQQPRFGQDLDAWVLRLRAPFDRQQFPSAASAALSAAVRTELDELWGHLARAQA